MDFDTIILFAQIFIFVILSVQALAISTWIHAQESIPKHVKFFAASALVLSILGIVMFFGTLIYSAQA